MLHIIFGAEQLLRKPVRTSAFLGETPSGNLLETSVSGADVSSARLLCRSKDQPLGPGVVACTQDGWLQREDELQESVRGRFKLCQKLRQLSALKRATLRCTIPDLPKPSTSDGFDLGDETFGTHASFKTDSPILQGFSGTFEHCLSFEAGEAFGV